ncbi:hypothetical protein D0Z07_4536 [Hyphodiscus hymeniophilus]|uniref:EthD domain-containing protein n=1 Tax=Hyphodiscus hymeniophilus TaxID=353542 RepID=A0A9P6VKB4_9HELO|nr:hypothetical protein D0Z07_4536 [Hyphodiscus hymeniophilus]
MDLIKPLSQFLLKRKPTLTQEEFSTHWFEKHGAIVAPYFLSSGFEYYAQIHGPLTTADAGLQEEFDGREWAGAAESIKSKPSPASPPAEPAWKKAYYDEIILADELRFLASSALSHFKMTDPGVVLGRR